MKLSLLLFQQAGWWVAQCLEFDIVGQGRSMGEAVFELQAAYFSELAICEKNNHNFQAIPPAPKFYWNLFESAEQIKLMNRIPVRSSVGSDKIPPGQEVRIASLVS